MLKSALNVAISPEYNLIKIIQEKNAIERLTIKIPKVESRTEEYIPSIKEAERIMKYLPKHLYELAFCAHRLGYRIGELCSLTFGSISWEQREIRLTKVKSKIGHITPRNTPLYKEINDFLKQMYDEAVEIFGRTNLNTELGDDGETKPKYHFHDLRKAAVKYLRIRYKFDRYMIQKLYTGHKSLEVFEKIYNAITTEDLEHYKKVALAS